MRLLPAERVAQISAVLQQLETTKAKDNNTFVGAAGYPDDFIRSVDKEKKFNPWHFADLVDKGEFKCEKDVIKEVGQKKVKTTKVHEECLFKALQDNLAIMKNGKGDKDQAVAIAWVMHLVGDLHQPLHMTGKSAGGNTFPVSYRGQADGCFDVKEDNGLELHKVWDNCLVIELAGPRGPRDLARDLVGKNLKTYKGRPEVATPGDQPWLAWGDASHALANSVAFKGLKAHDDLRDDYIKAPGKGLDVTRKQLLAAGIRLAFLLDQNFTPPSK